MPPPHVREHLFQLVHGDQPLPCQARVVYGVTVAFGVHFCVHDGFFVVVTGRFVVVALVVFLVVARVVGGAVSCKRAVAEQGLSFFHGVFDVDSAQNALHCPGNPLHDRYRVCLPRWQSPHSCHELHPAGILKPHGYQR